MHNSNFLEFLMCSRELQPQTKRDPGSGRSDFWNQDISGHLPPLDPANTNNKTWQKSISPKPSRQLSKSDDPAKYYSFSSKAGIGYFLTINLESIQCTL